MTTIAVDARVVPIGVRVNKQGQLVWETAPFAVGHHQGTGVPGLPGNLVLSGHISSPSEGDVFRRLPNVTVGDGIVVTSERHWLYLVTATLVVTPDAVQYIEPTLDPVATLITCVPDGVYSDRLIVRAALV
jgi:sortase A